MANRANIPHLKSGPYARFVSGRIFIAVTLLAAWIVAAIALSAGRHLETANLGGQPVRTVTR